MKTLGVAALAIVMVAASYFCTTLPGLKPQIFGWLGVFFFGLSLLLIPVRLIRGGVVVLIDDVGIEDRRTGIGTVPWEDIRALRIVKIKSTRLLCVDVTDPEKYMSILSPYKRLLAKSNIALGFSPVTIGFVGLTPSQREVWEYLRNKRPDLIVD